MVDNEKKREQAQDPNSIIRTAQSLQRVVQELERNAPEPSHRDTLLFDGMHLAVPVLLSLATEIALKAWQCRERNGAAPKREHDLLKLFDSLDTDTKRRLEAKMEGVSHPVPDDTKFPSVRTGLREALRLNNNAFVDWRYPYEACTYKVFEIASVKQALTQIIDTYYEPAQMPD